MPQWPHEYTVREWRPELEPQFFEFVELIRREGVVKPWPREAPKPRYHLTYLEIDGWEYWTMGAPLAETTVINRANEIRLWLDDDLIDRAAPEGWVHVTTAPEAIRLLDTRRVVELSLDHDLGDDDRFGRGIDVVDWLAEQQEVHDRPLWPRDGITIHSANAYGRDAMVRAIENYAGNVCRCAAR